jgi:RNA polymerase sigma-70 factor (ECF subfamily)
MKPVPGDIETELATLLDAGDAARAATAAIKGYGPEVLGYLTAILRDDDDAADAFSVFCEDLWRGIAAFRRESSVRTWAYRIAWHAAMRTAREPYRRRKRRLATGAASSLAAEVRSTTLAHLKQNNADRLAEVRRTLTPEEQTLLILRVDRNLSWTEIAHVMAEDGVALDDAALRKRFERLKERLRAKLAGA